MQHRTGLPGENGEKRNARENSTSNGRKDFLKRRSNREYTTNKQRG
jgi:hypothetical protein